MEHKIRVSVKGLFFNEKGEVLLIKGQFGDYWAFPGGGLEEGESLRDAAERELLEETGYIGKTDKIVYAQDYDSHSGRKQIEIFFNGQITDFDENVIPDHQAKFYNQENIKEITLMPQGIDPFDLSSGIAYRSEKD